MSQLWKGVVVAAMGTVVIGSTGGCSTLLPAHPNSYEVDGESVTVKFLDKAAMEARDLKLDWAAAFKDENPEMQPLTRDIKSGKIALGAATVISAAASFLKHAIQEEAALYEAQFVASGASNFWIVNYEDSVETQNVFGIEVKRMTKQHLTAGTPAFEAVFGISKNKEGMLTIAPLSMVIRGAKAKVLDTREWSFVPVFWWHALLNTGNEVKTEVAVEVDATAKNGDKAYSVRQTMPAFAGYPLSGDKDKGWSARDKDSPLLGKKLLPFDPIPVSAGYEDNKADKDLVGAFSVKFTFTERDPSNAKKLLDRAGDWVQRVEQRYEKSGQQSDNKTKTQPAAQPPKAADPEPKPAEAPKEPPKSKDQ